MNIFIKFRSCQGETKVIKIFLSFQKRLKASSTLLLSVTFLHDKFVKHSLNRSLFARDITLLFVKLGFSCTDVVGIKKKFIKWSLISLIIVPASFAEPREFVKIWSIRDIEEPCILVAFVIN